MHQLRHALLVLTLVPAAALAAEDAPPRPAEPAEPAGTTKSEPLSLDMLGGAAFTDTYITLGVGTVSGEARDSNTDFDALRLGFGAYSVSGYSNREKKDVGGLLGGALLIRSWFAKNHGIEYSAIAPNLVLVGGGFWKPAGSLRLDLSAEAGPGLVFARVSAGGETQNDSFKPTLYAGVHGSVRAQIRRDADLAVIVGYEYDHLPEVTIAGPVIAFAFIWRP